MGERYGQLSLEERIEIYRLHVGGKSLRWIGACLGRSASTIGRELARNSVRTKVWPGGYAPVRAEALARRRRRWGKRFKLVRQPDLQALVRNRLAMGWSPAQIAGRLALEASTMRISHESIYRFIAHRVSLKDHGWHVLLPCRRYYRGRRPRKGGPASRIFKDYRSIDERPREVATRETPGHWEADLMAFSRNRTVLLVAQERRSRKIFLHRQPDKSAQAVLTRLKAILQPLPPPLRQTLTCDNGTEFARHHLLKARIGIQTFICHTHSPWEKGGVENAIGRLRRSFPDKTPPQALTAQTISAAAERFNNTPRKCLGFLTPQEAFDLFCLNQNVALQS